jgi:CheY-like chemotaxis protein
LHGGINFGFKGLTVGLKKVYVPHCMGRNILVVDDEQDSRDAVCRFLQHGGHRVYCAANGNEAIALLGTTVPDAIVLDYRMPDMDGVSVLEVLRSYLRWTDIPVVILTAFPEEPRLWHIKDYGVKRVFVKSQYQLEDLLSYLEQVMSPVPPPPDLIPDQEQKPV